MAIVMATVAASIRMKMWSRRQQGHGTVAMKVTSLQQAMATAQSSQNG